MATIGLEWSIDGGEELLTLAAEPFDAETAWSAP